MKEKIELLESLLEDKNIKGKSLLRKVLWVNTAIPQFKVGDKVLFNEPQKSIYGNRCIGWKGVVVEVITYINVMSYAYKIESTCSLCPEKELHYILEDDVLTTISNEDMTNSITKKGSSSSSISI